MKIKSNSFLKIAILLGVIAVIFLLVEKQPGDVADDKLQLALIQYNDSPLSELSKAGIEEGLSNIGMNPGVDYDLKVSNAQGDIATLNLIVNTVAGEKPDLVFVTSTPTLQVVSNKVKDIPVIFSVVADPVLAGAGVSFTEHLSNVTGISTLGDYEGMVKWIKLILPQTKKIGTIFSPSEANSVKNMSELKKYAEKAGIELITTPVNSSSEVADAALSLVERKPEIVCQVVDNLTSASISTIIKVCQQKNIPLFGFVSDQSEKGAVLVVSRDYKQAGIDAVNLAKRVFDGEDISTIPFEFVSKTNVLINLKAAEKYGIVIPEDLRKKEGVIII
jgi:ABC-type uncharacterized transport system substrate-binding protein